MLRTSRVLVEGGICHVYNRLASAEPVFVDPEEAPAFTERAMGSGCQGSGLGSRQERGHGELSVARGCQATDAG